MAGDPTVPRGERSALLRWTSSAAIVLLPHALIAVALITRPDYIDLSAGSPIVMIELAPLPVAPPEPPRDLAPGLQQLQNESEERAKLERQPDGERKNEEPCGDRELASV
jgi:hypothetical protein